MAETSGVAKIKVIGDESGYATGGSQTTLVDSGKGWAVNVWQSSLIQITVGGVLYSRIVASNTSDTITLAALPVGVSVISGSQYTIKLTSNTTELNIIRWGRDITVAWEHAAEQVAPGAGAVLITRAVTAGMTGYVYGFFISTQEGNNFLLNWTSGGVAYSKRIVFGAAGSLEAVDSVALNEGLPADAGTNVTITNVTAAGGGMIYQANLLYGEV